MAKPRKGKAKVKITSSGKKVSYGQAGKAKGGGWKSVIAECYAYQSQKYEGWGHPEVGFRLFMEIIEP